MLSRGKDAGIFKVISPFRSIQSSSPQETTSTVKKKTETLALVTLLTTPVPHLKISVAAHASSCVRGNLH